MHNGFMPLTTAVANFSKAALAQGGFFAFAAGIFSTPLSSSHTTCPCLLPQPNVLIESLSRRLTRLHARVLGHNPLQLRLN
jgi:hypothetical protein